MPQYAVQSESIRTCFSLFSIYSSTLDLNSDQTEAKSVWKKQIPAVLKAWQRITRADTKALLMSVDINKH